MCWFRVTISLPYVVSIDFWQYKVEVDIQVLQVQVNNTDEGYNVSTLLVAR